MNAQKKRYYLKLDVIKRNVIILFLISLVLIVGKVENPKDYETNSAEIEQQRQSITRKIEEQQEQETARDTKSAEEEAKEILKENI